MDPVLFSNPPVPINFEKIWIYLAPADRDGDSHTLAKITFDGYYWWGWGSPVAHFLVICPFVWAGEGIEQFEDRFRVLYAYW